MSTRSVLGNSRLGPVYYFGNRLTDVSVGFFNVKQRSHGRCDVSHVRFTVGAAVLDTPAHHDKRDVCVIRCPGSVCGTSCPRRSAVPLRFEDDLDTYAPFRIVTVGNALTDARGDAGG